MSEPRDLADFMTELARAAVHAVRDRDEAVARLRTMVDTTRIAEREAEELRGSVGHSVIEHRAEIDRIEKRHAAEVETLHTMISDDTGDAMESNDTGDAMEAKIVELPEQIDRIRANWCEDVTRLQKERDDALAALDRVHLAIVGHDPPKELFAHAVADEILDAHHETEAQIESMVASRSRFVIDSVDRVAADMTSLGRRLVSLSASLTPRNDAAPRGVLKDGRCSRCASPSLGLDGMRADPRWNGTGGTWTHLCSADPVPTAIPTGYERADDTEAIHPGWIVNDDPEHHEHASVVRFGHDFTFVADFKHDVGGEVYKPVVAPYSAPTTDNQKDALIRRIRNEFRIMCEATDHGSADPCRTCGMRHADEAEFDDGTVPLPVEAPLDENDPVTPAQSARPRTA